MYYKVNKIIEEEINEKRNFGGLYIWTLVIYIIITLIISLQPGKSKQSKLNSIEPNEVDTELTVINKGLLLSQKNKLFEITNNTWKNTFENIKNNFKYDLNNIYKNDDNFDYQLDFYEYLLYSQDIDITVNNNFLLTITDSNDFNQYSLLNGTKYISFKSKNYLINNLFDYFSFLPHHPLRSENLLFLTAKACFKKKEENNTKKENAFKDNENNLEKRTINITQNDIIINYNKTTQSSMVFLLNNTFIDFSIMNKNIIFYIQGNVLNDNGTSVINIYNYEYNYKPIYSGKTDSKGFFKIGPLSPLNEEEHIYELNIEIYKIKINNIKQTINNQEIYEEVYIEDIEYNNYKDIIKIGGYGFSPSFPSFKNISLPKKDSTKKIIKGNVVENEDNLPLKDVIIKLFSGDKVINFDKIQETEEDILKEVCLSKTVTKEDGSFSFEINSNGQYLLLYIKDNYYIEEQNFVINDINYENLYIYTGTKSLVKQFNAGKIVVKLEWENNPPDLDLVCRFQVSSNYYCYTFFGNQVCVNSRYSNDIREGGKSGSEIIEISILSDYIYLFYVRKYIDTSKGISQNEYKINDIINLEEKNYSNNYIMNDEKLINSNAQILIYSNGLNAPMLKIKIPNEINYQKESNDYWAAFCINGKEGISSLKVLNMFYEEEPPKNICLMHYDEKEINSLHDN